MKRSSQHLQLLSQPAPEITFRGYPLIEPGEYPAYCRAAKTYPDPQFKRWVCMLSFNILSDDLIRTVARLPMWINLGSGDKTRASHRGKYVHLWVFANGAPPKRGDRLSPRVFSRRLAIVQVSTTEKSAIPYSIVKEILRWDTGVQGVKQSISQSVKEGTRVKPEQQ